MMAFRRFLQPQLVLFFLTMTSIAAVFAPFVSNTENTNIQHQVERLIGNRPTSFNHVTLPPLWSSQDVGTSCASSYHQAWNVPKNSTSKLSLRRLAQPFGVPDKHLTKSKRDSLGVCAQCWQEAVCKGERLQFYMRSSIEEATQQMGGPSESRWTNYPADFLNNQWRLEVQGNLAVAQAGINTVLNQLGLSADEPPNRVLTWSHPVCRFL
jgi:hypothetical protein